MWEASTGKSSRDFCTLSWTGLSDPLIRKCNAYMSVWAFSPLSNKSAFFGSSGSSCVCCYASRSTHHHKSGFLSAGNTIQTPWGLTLLCNGLKWSNVFAISMVSVFWFVCQESILRVNSKLFHPETSCLLWRYL